MRTVILAVTILSVAGAIAVPPAHAGDAFDAFVRQYVQRLDGISPDAGNSKDHNAVVHMVDPWPPYAARRHIDSNGARMAGAVERYRDVSKLPLAPPPISPVPIATSGFSSSGGGGGAGAAASTPPPSTAGQ